MFGGRGVGERRSAGGDEKKPRGGATWRLGGGHCLRFFVVQVRHIGVRWAL